MPETEITQAVASALSSAFTDYSVSAEVTDGANGDKEYRWHNPFWSKDYGYYKKIPELRTAIDAKATWTVGAGYTANEQTMMLLMNVIGNGKDSFNSILKNMAKIKTITGDSFAEIITDENDVLVNLKPLDPASIVIVFNSKGKIIRYEQVSKSNNPNKMFEPHKMFHLSHEKIADEVHGIRLIDSLEWLILARNEAMNDWKRVLHRNIDPLWVFHLDTDDASEISAFKSKMDSAHASGENMYIPKDVVVPELITTAQNSSLNPLAWINQLNDYFFQAVNVPQIIIGNAKEFTDASSKIVYLSYEQSVKAEQLYIEEQVLNQLNIEIFLTFPASLQNDVISGEQKQPELQAATPNDTVTELEGRT